MVTQETKPRIGLLLLGHGRFASGLFSAAQEIVGELPAVAALDFDPASKSDKEEILRLIHRCNEGYGVLILVDLFGGSPSNLAISVLEPGSVEVVCGVNLPMVLRALQLRERLTVSELAEDLLKTGRNQIIRPAQLLASFSSRN